MSRTLVHPLVLVFLACCAVAGAQEEQEFLEPVDDEMAMEEPGYLGPDGGPEDLEVDGGPEAYGFDEGLGAFPEPEFEAEEFGEPMVDGQNPDFQAYEEGLPADEQSAQRVQPARRRSTTRPYTPSARPDPEAVAPDPAERIRLNFKEASLDTVLDYLSEAAGFIIVRDVEVSGTVTVWSHQDLTADEAVSLLNTILNNRGYAAIRQERTLTIVDRDTAKERNIPVYHGAKPEDIPRTDEMITQIIPVRYADVAQLLENIQELLPEYAVATVNTSTNSIVLTDTQANVRRMAEIVSALDESISGITEMKVFHLNNAEAEETADLINDVFDVKDTGRSASGNRRGGGPGDFFARMRGMRGGPPGGGDNNSNASGESAARRAASNVVAVADERSNSVVVGAPGDMMPLVEQLVNELDGLPEELPIMRVFPLQFADAEEMAELIDELFNSENAGGGAAMLGGGRGGPPGMMQAMMRRMNRGGSSGSDGDAVQAVADTRTNSVVVTAIEQTMTIVEDMVEQLDANPAKDRKVFVYTLENADAEEVADILQQTFESSVGGNTNRRNTSTRNNTNNRTSANRNQSSSNQSNRRR